MNFLILIVSIFSNAQTYVAQHNGKPVSITVAPTASTGQVLISHDAVLTSGGGRCTDIEHRYDSYSPLTEPECFVCNTVIRIPVGSALADFGNDRFARGFLELVREKSSAYSQCDHQSIRDGETLNFKIVLRLFASYSSANYFESDRNISLTLNQTKAGYSIQEKTAFDEITELQVNGLILGGNESESFSLTLNRKK